MAHAFTIDIGEKGTVGLEMDYERVFAVILEFTQVCSLSLDIFRSTLIMQCYNNKDYNTTCYATHAHCYAPIL